jgi:hypothetical protein
VDQVQTIITDSGIAPEHRAALREKGMDVLVAGGVAAQD